MKEFIEIRNRINKSWGQHYIELINTPNTLIINYMFNWGTISGTKEVNSSEEVLKVTRELLEKHGIKKRRFKWG